MYRASLRRYASGCVGSVEVRPAPTIMNKVEGWNEGKWVGSKFAACMWVHINAVRYWQRFRPPTTISHVVVSTLILPLPLSSRTCRCGRVLDVCCHHRAVFVCWGVGRQVAGVADLFAIWTSGCSTASISAESRSSLLLMTRRRNTLTTRGVVLPDAQGGKDIPRTDITGEKVLHNVVVGTATSQICLIACCASV